MTVYGYWGCEDLRAELAFFFLNKDMDDFIIVNIYINRFACENHPQGSVWLTTFYCLREKAQSTYLIKLALQSKYLWPKKKKGGTSVKYLFLFMYPLFKSRSQQNLSNVL